MVVVGLRQSVNVGVRVAVGCLLTAALAGAVAAKEALTPPPPPKARPAKPPVTTIKPPSQPVPWEGGSNLALPPPTWSADTAASGVDNALAKEDIANALARAEECLIVRDLKPVTAYQQVVVQFALAFKSGGQLVESQGRLIAGDGAAGERFLAAMTKAVAACAPYDDLPPEQFAQWKNVTWQYQAGPILARRAAK